jgi:hypothetical protein
MKAFAGFIGLEQAGARWAGSPTPLLPHELADGPTTGLIEKL